MKLILRLFNEFSSLTLQVVPYFILGTSFGAVLATYLKPESVSKYLNKGMGPVVNASVLGAILPGCACATMPMAEGLKSKGAGLGTVAAFIFVSPLLSPQTVILTYGMLGLKFALARVVFSLTGAITIGLVFSYFEHRKLKGFVLHNQKEGHGCGSCCAGDGGIQRKSFLENFLQITQDLGKYFLLGMLIASLLTVLIPEEMIPKYIGSSGAFAYLVAVVVGIPVYICEGEEIPLTAALLKLGLGQGPAMSFLLGAVGTCIPTMIMAQKIIGKRPTFVYVLFWFVFAVAAGVLFSGV